MPTKPKAQDFTGRQKAALEKEHAEELAKRSEEMSVAAQVEAAQIESEVIDVTESPAAPTVIVDSVEEIGVTLADETIIIRVNEDIMDMTYGAGNMYTFLQGRKYKVSKDLASWLEEKGYLWTL
jgi:ferritin-like protein